MAAAPLPPLPDCRRSRRTPTGWGISSRSRYEEAITAFGTIGERAPGDFRVGIARVHALMGDRQKARQMIGGVRANPDALAAVYVALGDIDEAFTILNTAITERQNAVAIKVDPPLERLHSDPRWQALLTRMNLPRD